MLVMDAGRVVEFAHPYELLQKSDGHLRTLVDQTGLATAGQLFKIASDNYQSKKLN